MALGVKMNILLFLPGLLVLLFQHRGVYGTVESVLIIAIVQVSETASPGWARLTCSVQLLLPAPYFLSDARHSMAYVTSAFDFSRQFLYEWTVNWRFVSKDIFHSREAATALLVGHVSFHHDVS